MFYPISFVLCSLLFVLYALLEPEISDKESIKVGQRKGFACQQTDGPTAWMIKLPYGSLRGKQTDQGGRTDGKTDEHFKIYLLAYTATYFGQNGT